MKLSEHFTLEEMTVTNSGLPNVPDQDHIYEMTRLCNVVLEGIRSMIGPMHINSGFRSPQVNEAIRGHAQHSQHMDGQAADFVPMQMDLEQAFQVIKASGVPYDQLIREPTWIHVSCNRNGKPPRRQCLRMHRDESGNPVYEGA